MAAADGPSPDDLTFPKSVDGERAGEFGVFALLRLLEARAPDRPPIGRSKLPEQNVVDLAHAPELGFPAASVQSLHLPTAESRTKRKRLSTLFLGLTGPMGPMPLHLTELVHNERLYGKQHPIGRFIDLLAGRMLQFFYRAWADTQPAVAARGPGKDPFADYIAALAGIRAAPGSAFPRDARLRYAGLFASRRNPAALVDCLSGLLGTRVSLREFLPRWRDIEPEDRTRIGARGAFNRLGAGAALGGRVRTVDDTFAVRIHCASLDELHDYLPDGRKFPLLHDALDALAPPHLEWRLEIAIPENRTAQLDGSGRPIMLGTRHERGTPLGWASWLGPRDATDRIRNDIRLARQRPRAVKGKGA